MRLAVQAADEEEQRRPYPIMPTPAETPVLPPEEVEEAEDTSMRQRKAPTTAGSKLTILTYNAGLLRFQLLGPCGLGGTVFSNPPCVPERFPHLAAALLDSGADIIALQEVYEKTHVALHGRRPELHQRPDVRLQIPPH